jgi:hypothetical protein
LKIDEANLPRDVVRTSKKLKLLRW